MAYTPENNPYIPGDPYSYDLKWVVDEINECKQVRAIADQAVSVAQQAADNAYTSANKAEAWAIGYYEGEPVQPGEPQYENNAKYYAEQAGASAQSASDDAADAHADMLSAKDYADNIADPVSGLVTSWLTDHITNPSSPPVDTSLSVGGAAADAAVVGSKLAEINEDIGINDARIDDGFSILSNEGYAYQYIKMSAFTPGEYYQYNSVTDVIFTIANSGYKVQTIEIPPGTYNYKNIQGIFSFLRNKITQAVVDFSTLNGGIAANSSGTFTISYPAIFYITGGYYQSVNMISKGTLPASQIEGWYFSDSEPLRRIFRCGAGENYTQFYAALSAAMAYENSILYIEPGTYDLVSELGSSYFSGYDHNVDGWGPVIGNGVEIICAPGSKLTCIYEGANTEVHKYFSPLNAIRHASKNNNFSIHNMNIEAKNCRYIMHDECNIVNVSYKHTYQGCVMHLNNVSSLSDLNTRQTIGGGLGLHGYIEIADCIFSCDGGWAGVDVLSYHNNSANNAESKIVFTRNYCKNQSTARFSSYGTQSTYITQVLASNNSLGYAISTRKETPESADNVEVVQWNNEVR